MKKNKALAKVLTRFDRCYYNGFITLDENRLWIRTAFEAGYKNGKASGPQGVSKWKNAGKKYGYDKYFNIIWPI